MNVIIYTLSLIFGLLPFNRVSKTSVSVIDYVMMIVVPIGYLTCFCMITFKEDFGVQQLPECNSICRLGNILFMYLGCFLYFSVYLITLRRGKRFFMTFQKCLDEIDGIITKCHRLTIIKPKPKKFPYISYLTWLVLFLIFGYALYYDFSVMYWRMKNRFAVSIMITAFPFIAGSIIQGQFVYFVSVIMDRFNRINNLFEAISQECDRKNGPLSIFDIESSMTKEKKIISPKSVDEKKGKNKQASKVEQKDDLSSSDDDEHENEDDDQRKKDEDFGIELPTDGHTSETNLQELFKLHDKILELSVITNGEFGIQCVPFMTVCFVVGIFGIFLETKVIFIVGGKSALLDYTAQMYVMWSLIMMVVGYMVLRLCCNANSKSKNSAMIVHEIMQKKPSFMLGNDLYYNKMKAFTLQFLHWEGFFQFNGLGLFVLDYTFIFSTVSAATSYLIVLLQFDMTAILKTEGLL